MQPDHFPDDEPQPPVPSPGLQRALAASALALQVFAQLLVGVALGLAYHPTLAAAYSSDGALRQTALGGFAASFHYWGSALLILHSALHLLTMLFTGGFRRTPLGWYAALLVFLGAYGMQITGNILPMDRHGVQTAVVESGIAAGVPFVGVPIRDLLDGGYRVGEPTLRNWYFLHAWLLPVILLLGVAGLLVTASRELKSRDPEVKLASEWPAYFPLAMLAMLALSIPAPRGAAAGVNDFTSFRASVSWYTWPLHGMLSAADRVWPSAGWLGSVVWPGLTLLFLFLLPVLPLNKPAAATASTLFLAPFLILPIFFGGPVASLVGNRDPKDPPSGPGFAVGGTPTPVPPADPKTLLAGRDLFNSSGCSNCHGKNGSNGDAGPDLSTLYKTHDPNYVMKYVRNPKSQDPTSTMPPFPNLPQGDLNKIAAFLGSPRSN